MIKFNRIFQSGKETEYIQDAMKRNNIGSGGFYSKQCEKLLTQKYGYRKCLATSSCTAALEISSLLAELNDGDEVIMPSYTFVSTANSIMLRKAIPVFADSSDNSPNIDAAKIEKLITDKTKALIIVHYAGIACDLEKIKNITDKYNILLIEDAAHSIDAYYNDKPLGSIGDLSAFSFHETKNITAGEGGMLVVNNEKFFERAEMIRDKGTNRAKYLRGEINKYEWVEIGSSFGASEINMAFLYAQLQNIDVIQKNRIDIWNQYYNELKVIEEKKLIELPYTPNYARHNAHIFYVVCNSKDIRDRLIKYLSVNNIASAFHYLSLHKSPYFRDKYKGEELNNSDRYSDCLIRFPLYSSLKENEINYITGKVKEFFSC